MPVANMSKSLIIPFCFPYLNRLSMFEKIAFGLASIINQYHRDVVVSPRIESVPQ